MLEPRAHPRHANRGGRAPAATGRQGEALAAAHLQRLGFSVLGRNVRSGAGEIDLIAYDGRTLAFVEVKTRSARVADAGRAPPVPLERVGAAQRARLRRLALGWLRERPRPIAAELRFDAIGVVVDGRGGLLALEHVENAW